MVSIQKIGGVYNVGVLELTGNSTDTKPTITFEGVRITNGSIYLEMDNNNVKIYIYDQENETWHEM